MKKIQDLPANGRYMSLPGPMVDTGEVWFQMKRTPEEVGQSIGRPIVTVGGPLCGKWSNPELIQVGDRVKVTFNQFGIGTVKGFFTDNGGAMAPGDMPFAGLEVEVDKQPAWHLKQNGPGKLIHVFGAEVVKLQPEAPKRNPGELFETSAMPFNLHA